MEDKKQSYSQIGQDIEVLNFYKNIRNGFFIEIGASDGINLSNTYLLETEYNWKGICVEPLPNKINILKINRPNSICIEKAVYNESNLSLKFDIANNCDLLSGISDNINRHKEIVDQNKTIIYVETISLNDILEQNNAPNFINYMSLDTEGSELEILKSCNFNKYKFGLIDVEHNYVQPIRTEIRNLLEKNGYKFIRENQFDDCYMLMTDT